MSVSKDNKSIDWEKLLRDFLGWVLFIFIAAVFLLICFGFSTCFDTHCDSTPEYDTEEEKHWEQEREDKMDRLDW